MEERVPSLSLPLVTGRFVASGYLNENQMFKPRLQRVATLTRWWRDIPIAVLTYSDHVSLALPSLHRYHLHGGTKCRCAMEQSPAGHEPHWKLLL